MNTCLYFLLITFVLLNSLPSIRHVDNFLSISLKGGGIIVLEFMSTPIGTKKKIRFQIKPTNFLSFCLSERNLYWTSQIMNKLFIEKDTLWFVHKMALKRKFMFCFVILLKKKYHYIDCWINLHSFTVSLTETFFFCTMIHLFPSSGLFLIRTKEWKEKA